MADVPIRVDDVPEELPLALVVVKVVVVEHDTR